MVAVLAATLLTSCSSDPAAPSSDAAASAAAVARELPGAAPEPAPTVAADVEPGTVTLQAGPFTDRLRISALALGPDAVTGAVDVVSDVSEIIALEVSVAFYDDGGTLVGSDSQVFETADTEQYHSEAGVVGLPFSVPLPAASDGAVSSAVVSVPVLVNE